MAKAYLVEAALDTDLRSRIDGQPVPVHAEGDRPDRLLEDLAPHHHIYLGIDGGPDYGPAIVPDAKLLVLGDNRGNSRDGRFFGFIDVRSVRGHAVGVYARSGRPTSPGL